jgi:hypothetical protein
VNAICTRRIIYFEIGQSLTQSRRIQLIDGEYANATLRASGATHEPLATTFGCVSQCGVNDLDQGAVADQQSPWLHG